MEKTVDLTIEEGNKLIAEFMKLTCQEWKSSLDGSDMKLWLDANGLTEHEGELFYHSSWDLLHGAWEKFRDMKLSLEDEGFCDQWSRHCKAVSTALYAYPINVAFERLVRAIQWYNQKTE